MDEKMKRYFIEEKKVTEQVAKILSKSLLKYEDIAKEFCYWMDNRKFPDGESLIIGGYSASDISMLAPHMDPAGVYNFMVTLRDEPDRAKECISKGFPVK